MHNQKGLFSIRQHSLPFLMKFIYLTQILLIIADLFQRKSAISAGNQGLVTNSIWVSSHQNSTKHQARNQWLPVCSVL